MSQQEQTPQRSKSPPLSKIPVSAVEMPGQLTTTVDVQFGNFEFGSENVQFSFEGNETVTDVLTSAKSDSTRPENTDLNDKSSFEYSRSSASRRGRGRRRQNLDFIKARNERKRHEPDSVEGKLPSTAGNRRVKADHDEGPCHTKSYKGHGKKTDRDRGNNRKAHRCKRDTTKKDHLSYMFSSDEYREGAQEDTAENEEFSARSNGYAVQYGGEIDGCRKQVRIPDRAVENTNNTFTEKGLENNTNSRKVIGFPFLKKLMGKDAGYIVSELTRTPQSLKDCILRTSKEEDFLEVFLRVLAEAFKSRTTPSLMIRLFETLKEIGFFETLMKYVVDLLIKVTSGQTRGENVQKVLKNIVSIIIEQTIRNPASLSVFLRIHALLGQVINTLDKNSIANDDLKSEYQRLTEHKENIETDQKQYLGRNQDKSPPNDFRQYPVSPSPGEITGAVRPFLRPNKTDGEYEDLEHYLDVQFRLLREDFVGPLREGMADYIRLVTTDKKRNKRKDKPNLRHLDIKVYENVRVHSPVVTDKGLCYKLLLEMTESLKRTNWKFSKRLIYGSMVCLTDKDFNDFFLATVVEREEKDIKNGFFVVHFEQEELTTHDVLHKTFRMAETTGYFESYRHVLSSLQSIKDGDLPFEKYIVGCKKVTNPPAYLTPETTYDLRPLVDNNIVLQESRQLCSPSLGNRVKAKSRATFSRASNVAKAVPVTNHIMWPSNELLHMDNSQYKAVQTALTNELAIIQGPPGTGKTYIGLQIVKALLHNKSAWAGTKTKNRPMLIVCYTNHALDQFVEGIVKFFKGDVLRVGGRSSSASLEAFNLKRHRQVHHGPKTELGRLQIRKREALRDLNIHSELVQFWAAKIQMYRSEIVTENVLLPEMGKRLYNNLVNGFRGKKKKDEFSYIGKWLGIGYIQKECMEEVLSGKNGKHTKLIRVEDDATRRMRERMIDIGDEVKLTADSESKIHNIREEQVAFFVPNTKAAAQKSTDGEKTLNAKYLKHLKSTIIAKISDNDIMSEHEAETIPDVWRLNHHTKWRLYRLWIQKLCTKIYDKIEEKRRDFEEASERYQEASAQGDKEIMRQAAVIGMTTSGAARYQSVLRDIGPRIIVVEEAAEVLEAHIITTLSKKCEHLILIGDHKQLRPNPTVYKLAVKYHLDVSFFERMVTNDMPFNSLELQHRMRPEISSIMRHIYPDLKDHEHVETYPNVKGISTNLFLINHTHSENSNKDIKSYSNQKEAEYAVALCRYLLLQGYTRNDITLLTTYTGQLICIRNLMPREEFEGVKLTVVDNYQGEENEILILSLVRSNDFGKIGFLQTENRICVALSRAKVGFYVLGNFDHLATHSTLWKQISDDMKEKGYFGEGLKLYCQNHPNESAIVVKSPEEFRNAPEGGCSKICEARLQCGHKCEKYCHVLDQRHETIKCQKPCTKTLCEFQHICPDKCYMECRPCKELVTKTVPKCGHSQQVPCAMNPELFSCKAPCEKKLKCGHKCQNICGGNHSRCSEKIHFTWPCGHISTICCWEAESKLCPSPCETILKCEHICSGTCGTCFNGRVHQPCRQVCSRNLICSHQCKDYCDNCPPCTEPCRNRCVHSKCTKRCGERCIPCKEPCIWECSHYKCTRLCSEPCNRLRCNRACNKTLKCQHKCIGLCGEPCPPLCRICDKEQVTEIFFGDEDEPDATFVLLEDCSHIFETKAMDKYMLIVNVDEGIQLKCCPLCKTPIRKCLRYGKIVNRTLKDIERVKKEIIGNFRIYETVKRQVDAISPKNRTDLRAGTGAGRLSPDETKRLQQYQYYMDLCKNELGIRLDELRKTRFYTEKQLLTIQNQQRIAVAIIDVRQKIECLPSLKTSQPKAEKDLISFLQELLPNILQPRNCLTDQEIEDFMSEIERAKAYVKLLKLRRATKSAKNVADAKSDIEKMELLVLEESRFTADKGTEVHECFERVSQTLKIEGPCISEDERLEIIKAMGLTKGHWFKCPNNHIYAIGECGGATQRGKCPECNADIGGEHHRLTDGNQLAREMDGADYAAYSEEANNMANFDLNNLH
ncbi:NFX1-type zinc finger-containing protein 1-like [Mercenaria mercenaria]|uniref:NFX1-type zinc finger-containing protein 1-like n=1 Tax=Mercenaria mercenaria TaxID=6596 RepID=UPI00234F05B2|nr:NFX1-type zinc finger-containing protein 1-like [Mercenaria mercenaria]XP_053404553.1 NFX1-type zinc finger-containing protein 1-like [Mercenaria mercenaria]